MASGDPRRAALGGGLFMVGVLVDHMDGEFARLTGMTSRFGHYYDHVAAGLGYVSLFAGLGIGLRSGWLGSWAPIAGAIAAGSIAVVFLIRVFLEETAGRAMVAQENWRGFEPEDALYLVGPVVLAGPPRDRSCWPPPSARRCSCSGCFGAPLPDGRPPHPRRRGPPRGPFDAARSPL